MASVFVTSDEVLCAVVAHWDAEDQSGEQRPQVAVVFNDGPAS